MGNPFFSQAIIQERNRELERLASTQRHATSEVTNHLSAVRLFATCKKKELRAIAKTAKIATIHSDAQIINEGDEGNTMYVILTGTARVSRNGRKLATIGPGDAFGELALLSKGPRTATVVALSEMEVAIITRRQLSKLLEEAPSFARRLLEALANTVRELDKKIV